MKKCGFFLCLLLSSIFFYGIACDQGSSPDSGIKPEVVSEPKSLQQIPVKASYEVEWEKALAAGKKEGVVVVYSIMEPTVRDVMRKTFKDKYGIDLEFVTGRGTELLGRARVERSNGLFLADVLMGGPTTCLTFKEAGALDPIETAVILPEVKDSKFWSGGGFHFFDKDHYTMAYWVTQGSNWIINTDLVKPEEASSYKDLLNAKWKGKMTLVDPTLTGSGNQLVGINMWELMGEEYVRSLAKQDIAITRDLRLHVESVARGKYPIGLAADPEVRISFQREGAPISEITPIEGGSKIAGAGGLGIFNKQPHPGATKIFINWLLSQDGQTVIGKAGGAASRRVDVSTDFVVPDRLLKPGVKYVEADTEETIRLRVQRQGQSREIFNIR